MRYLAALLPLLLSMALAFNQTQYWFRSQKLDHFDLTNTKVWSMRYWTIDDFWATPDGPIILNLCGEYTCPGLMTARLFPLALAKEHGAKIVTVEHRFYGFSQPTGDLTVASLKYHNSRQALNDWAYFSEWYQEQLNAQAGRPVGYRNKWINVGGSYPGALSAWYRLKFPHLTLGAISSSGVVNAILDFTAFDQQVATAVGQECADALRKATAQTEACMPGCKKNFGAGAEKLTDGDFYFYIADSAAESVQYGHRHALCDSILPAYRAGGDMAKSFANYTTSYFMKVLGNSPLDYSTDLFSDPKLGGDGRSWWWQTCTEVGWWQVAPAQGSIRSQKMNRQYHIDACKKMFGLTTLPDVNGTNNYYGGAKFGGSNVFFSNGIDDPWQWAGVRQTINPSLPAQVIDCDQCGHCVELYTEQDGDSQNLKDARTKIRSYVSQWLS